LKNEIGFPEKVEIALKIAIRRKTDFSLRVA